MCQKAVAHISGYIKCFRIQTKQPSVSKDTASFSPKCWDPRIFIWMYLCSLMFLRSFTQLYRHVVAAFVIVCALISLQHQPPPRAASVFRALTLHSFWNLLCQDRSQRLPTWHFQHSIHTHTHTHTHTYPHIQPSKENKCQVLISYHFVN